MNDPRYYPNGRFRMPVAGGEFESPYDIPSELLQDLIGRRIEPVFVVTKSLAVAQSTPIELPSGFGLVIYGHDGSDIRTINTTAIVYAQFNQFDAAKFDSLDSTSGIPFGFPMKHARGYRGPFAKAFLTWPAQSGVYADIIVHRYSGLPWIDGESAT